MPTIVAALQANAFFKETAGRLGVAIFRGRPQKIRSLGRSPFLCPETSPTSLSPTTRGVN